MQFIETPAFTQLIVELLPDDAYAAMQVALLLRPRLGPVIQKSGGLRKARWAEPGKGKRGGLRVIYFWNEPSETFYMLFVYRKSEQDDLNAEQLRVLSRLVQKEFG